MDVALGVLLGWAVVASAVAGWRLLWPRPVLSGEGKAMQAALHAAAVTLPHLRQGLTPETAAKAVPRLRTLTQAAAVALADRDTLLAFDGAGDDHHHAGAAIPVAEHRPDRLHVEPALRCPHPGCPLRAAVAAPIVVQDERVGSLLAFYVSGARISPEDVRVVKEAASLVSAQVALSLLEAQGERLARAELRALRAQISPHFVYNALAAVASYIHTRPEEARELLTEFAEFTRYAFRAQSPYVTIADELRYVEKYLRLEQARFGERLRVRLEVAPEVLNAVVPVLSIQPLVENAVRHGVERRGGLGRVEILGRPLDDLDVELRIRDDGAGIDADAARAALAGTAGGIGLANVHARLQATFGREYGLEIDGEDGGTTVVMTVPKFRAGVRAA